jgi:hypothetical protein
MVLRLLSTLACLAVATGQWTTVTYYDVLQEDCRGDIANKDMGDPAGDAYCKKGERAERAERAEREKAEKAERKRERERERERERATQVTLIQHETSFPLL